MYRILLAIEDYQELMQLQVLLRKLGFDVEGIQTQRKFEKSRVSFLPQMIIATALGRSVTGLAIARTLRKKDGMPRLLLLRGRDQIFRQGLLQDPNVDDVLESPVQPEILIARLAHHGAQTLEALQEKYQRLSQSGAGVGNEIVRGSGQHDGENESFVFYGSSDTTKEKVWSRGERLARVQEKQGKPINPREHFPSDRIRAFNKAIRAEAKEHDDKDLDENRKEFVRALFKKG